MKRIFAWAPVLIWMVIIFLLSSRTRIQLSEETTVNFLVFKFLHVIEYAVLYTLIFRAVRYERPYDHRLLWFFSAFVMSVIYAASDEIHQTFTPTREGRARDVIIDTIGITLSWHILQRLPHILPRKLHSLAKRLVLV